MEIKETKQSFIVKDNLRERREKVIFSTFFKWCLSDLDLRDNERLVVEYEEGRMKVSIEKKD